jgi:hypothetical protein
VSRTARIRVTFPTWPREWRDLLHFRPLRAAKRTGTPQEKRTTSQHLPRSVPQSTTGL